jgi:glycosyltransferase involved in cell wall biosynthesis
VQSAFNRDHVGGVPELIDHGKTGFLTEVGDVATMAECGLEVLKDDARLREMGELARFEAQTRFCSTNIIAQYEEFYARVLERTE